jgi:hypothetical protein
MERLHPPRQPNHAHKVHPQAGNHADFVAGWLLTD